VLRCKGYQSAPTLYVRPPGSVCALIARAGERSAAKAQKNAQNSKNPRNSINQGDHDEIKRQSNKSKNKKYSMEKVK
jgi:hypothetical protein